MRRDVELVELTADAIEALAAGTLDGAGVAFEPTPYLVSARTRRVWRMRAEQLVADPSVAPWVTRVIVDVERGRAVGVAGFHGPPDARGMVEVGYAVDPAERRRGYGRAALESLLDRARAEPGVRVVRASIAPDNTASLALLSGYGFVAVGEQWDEEDGLETLFELEPGAVGGAAEGADAPL